uniref:Uncharacterized protein n=1 Tax=Rhizophora mucronata TaxID=61149 RepID=A0A2P2QVG9_RHIMU
MWISTSVIHGIYQLRPRLERKSGTFSVPEIESTRMGLDPIEQPRRGIGRRRAQTRS